MRTKLTFASPPLRNSSSSKLRRRPHLLRYQAQRRRRTQIPGAGSSFATSNCLGNRQQHLTTHMPLGCRHGWRHKLTQNYKIPPQWNKPDGMKERKKGKERIGDSPLSVTSTQKPKLRNICANYALRKNELVLRLDSKLFWQCCRFPITLSESRSIECPWSGSVALDLDHPLVPWGWGLLAKSALLTWKPWGGVVGFAGARVAGVPEWEATSSRAHAFACHHGR